MLILDVPEGKLSKMLYLSSTLSHSGADLIDNDRKEQDDGEANTGTDIGQMTWDSKSKEEFLPCWKWLDDSCSLDAVLLLSLRVHHELPAKCQTLSSADVEPVYESWRKAIQYWQSKGG
jgi:hypothetical protein